MRRATTAGSRARALALTLLVLALPPAATAQVTRRPAAVRAVDDMALASGREIAATYSRHSGLITFLRTEPGFPIPVRVPGTAAERAREFLTAYGHAFAPSPNDLELARVAPADALGMERVRFRQLHRGVPIAGGELSVHLRGPAVAAVHAKTVPDPLSLDVTPTLTPAAAAEIAARSVVDLPGGDNAILSEPRLEILNRGLLEGRQTDSQIAWFVEAGGPALREFVWVDAHTGRVLLQFSQLAHALDREVYDADDPGDGDPGILPGTLVRSEDDAATGDADIDNAYEHSGDVYDYFFDEHGRDSFDGTGATLISSVRFCPSSGPCPYLNAFWNGMQMVYGEGFPAADDVVAHEITHAVTEFSANLFYYMQSGALNESYSDIFGETVDLLNLSGNDDGEVRWEIGEDLPTLGTVRDMMDPPMFDDPGRLGGVQFVCEAPGNDAGGVHSNSGVPNHAYALMVDGGSFNGFSITGIGLVKAGKVQYRALTTYLLSASDFLDNYNALQQSCLDLVGGGGLTAADCDEVKDALDAVEMSDPWPCASPFGPVAPPPYCAASTSAPSLAFLIDFESPLGISDCPPVGTVIGWCHNGPGSSFGPFATSGTRSFWGYAPGFAAAFWFSLALNGTLPAGTQLRFDHSYGFQNAGTTYHDGGFVEYNTEGGDPEEWTDAGGLITGGATYGGSLSSSFGNPFPGHPAFVADSWGFTGSRFDLSSFAGTEDLQIRWWVSTDSNQDDYGWFIDDLAFYTCADCVTDRVLDAQYNGSASLYEATNSVTAGDGFTVGFGEDVTFQAGAEVALDEGFSVASGGMFTAGVSPTGCP